MNADPRGTQQAGAVWSDVGIKFFGGDLAKRGEEIVESGREVVANLDMAAVLAFHHVRRMAAARQLGARSRLLRKAKRLIEGKQ